MLFALPREFQQIVGGGWGGGGGEEKHSPRVQKKKERKKKRQICNSGAKKGSRGSQSKPGKTAGERAGALACLLINKALSSRQENSDN